MKNRAGWLGAALVAGLVFGCSGDLTDLGQVDDPAANNDGSGDGSTGSGQDGKTTAGGVVGGSATSGTGGTADPGSGSGVGGSPEESVVAAAAVSGVGGADEGTVVVGSVGTTGIATGGSADGEEHSSSVTGTGGAEATTSGYSVSTVGVGGAGATFNEDCSAEVCPGLCFGTSCDGEWRCHGEVYCPEDDEQVAWCGCDGETFYASSGCPDRAFAHLGECE